MAPISVLNRELYDIQLAARVLKMPPTTLEWWLEGGRRQGRPYPPVIRDTPTGSKVVTWGELVEARYLLAYRRELRVGLPELRAWINLAREQLGVPYPLAHQRPWVGEGQKILTDAQLSVGLPEELWAMYQVPGGQILLLPPADAFLRRVVFEHGEVARLRPLGEESPIVIDPQIRFGMATLKGIPTEAIAEQVEAGDPVEMVAEDFGLQLAEVAQVLDYELNLPAAAA